MKATRAYATVLTALAAVQSSSCGFSIEPAAPAASRDAQATTSTAVDLRYVANAGVLLTWRDTPILIDAPIRDGIPPYATSDAGERERLEGAQPPYDRIAAILITHWHEDHFSADAVAAHLSHNGRAVLVSSPEVIERVKAVAPGLPTERLRAVLPAPGASALVEIGPVPVRVLRIRHNPTRRWPEQHVGFLVGDPGVLHTGDADPTAENFAVLRGLPAVDVALVPFWFLHSGRNRQFVGEAIGPRHLVAMHLPPADVAAVRREFADAGVRAALLTEPGTPVAWPR